MIRLAGAASTGGGACTVVVSAGPSGDTVAASPPVVVVVVLGTGTAGTVSGSSPAASARAASEISRPAIARILNNGRALMGMSVGPNRLGTRTPSAFEGET